MSSEFDDPYVMWIPISISVFVFLSLVIIVIVLLNADWSNTCKTNKDCDKTSVCVINGTTGVCMKTNGIECNTNSECASGFCSNTNICDNRPIDPPPPLDDPTTRKTIIKQKAVHIRNSIPPLPPIPDQRPPIPPIRPPPPSKEEQIVQKAKEVIDAVNFSSYVVYLMDTNAGTIIKRDAVTISTDLKKIIGLASFNGNLLALAEGKVYNLVLDTLDKQVWKFIPYNDILKEIYSEVGTIKRIGSDVYAGFLYIQTELNLYVFNKNGLEEQIPYPSNYRRIYGPTMNDYIDLDIENNVARVTGGLANGQIMNYIHDIVMDHSGHIFPLTVNRSKMEGYNIIRLISWAPQYF